MDDGVVWVSGHQGTYARSTDGGATWEAGVVPGAERLQFRDVAAFDDRTAYLMSAGSGSDSRIFRTDDGGGSWRLQYTADHPDAFLDCMDFWTPERGLVYGDAVDGVLFVLSTSDGGSTWARIPAERLPPALDGEGGFAASGTCLVTGAGESAWIATGNAARARVLRTSDYGESWVVADVPVVAGPASGLATIAMRSDGHGIALGGVIGNDSIRTDNVALTSDGGVSWRIGGRPAMGGPVYGVALVPGAPELVVAVGPRGLDWSADGGLRWVTGDPRTHWAVAFASAAAGWAVGPDGRITKISFVGP